MELRRQRRWTKPHLRKENPSRCLRLGAEDTGEIEADRLVQLGVRTRLWFAVRAPARELGGVPEPDALHVLVPHLNDPLRPQRNEREILARIPPAALALARRAGALLLLCPGPRVVVEGGDQRLQLDEELLAPGQRERADDPDAGQVAGVVVEPEEQRSDHVRAALVQPVSGQHAVGGPLVLDLE